MDLRVDEVKSAIGVITLVASRDALCAVDFADRRERMLSRLASRYGSVRLVHESDPGGYTSRLEAYLEGDLDALDGIAVDAGGTPFQRRVWGALRSIPPGSTASYTEIAAAIGRPEAARAVGVTNARNPVAVVVPCHRVVAADGSLSGYAGGVTRKRWLLEHEGVVLPAH